jgi:hypothetical protein
MQAMSEGPILPPKPCSPPFRAYRLRNDRTVYKQFALKSPPTVISTVNSLTLSPHSALMLRGTTSPKTRS